MKEKSKSILVVSTSKKKVLQIMELLDPRK